MTIQFYRRNREQTQSRSILQSLTSMQNIPKSSAAFPMPVLPLPLFSSFIHIILHWAKSCCQVNDVCNMLDTVLFQQAISSRPPGILILFRTRTSPLILDYTISGNRPNEPRRLSRDSLKRRTDYVIRRHS